MSFNNFAPAFKKKNQLCISDFCIHKYPKETDVEGVVWSFAASLNPDKRWKWMDRKRENHLSPQQGIRQ